MLLDGYAPEILEAIAKAKPKRAVCVSYPDTLARDMTYLDVEANIVSLCSN